MEEELSVASIGTSSQGDEDAHAEKAECNREKKSWKKECQRQEAVEWAGQAALKWQEAKIINW